MPVCKKAWGHPFATFRCWDHQTVMKWIPFFVFLCTALPGCGQSRSPEEVFTQLLERISNVTEVTVKSMDPFNLLPSYPRPRDLVLPVEDIRVGFSTYIGLGRCGLVGEVSARNSSLGKFQSPTARLLYERRFLRQLKRCIQDLQQSNERETKKFLAEVQSIADKKTAILPTVYWNATFGSPEFRVLLSTLTRKRCLCNPVLLRRNLSPRFASSLLRALSVNPIRIPKNKASSNPNTTFFNLQS